MIQAVKTTSVNQVEATKTKSGQGLFKLAFLPLIAGSVIAFGMACLLVIEYKDQEKWASGNRTFGTSTTAAKALPASPLTISEPASATASKGAALVRY